MCVAVWLCGYTVYICALSQSGVPAGAHECVPLGDEAERGHVPVDGEDAPHPGGAPRHHHPQSHGEGGCTQGVIFIHVYNIYIFFQS